MSCEGIIEDPHFVYRVCHQNNWDPLEGAPEWGAFEFDEVDDKISVYWAQRIDVKDVLPLHDTMRQKAATKRGVLGLRAGDVRAGGMLCLDHTPHDPEAKHVAHSSIGKNPPGYNRMRAYDLLVEASCAVIPVPPK